VKKMLEMIVPIRMEARETMPTNAAWMSLFMMTNHQVCWGV
jgi:hypothetical protein